MSMVDQEFMDGYLDGRDPHAPQPGANRHPAYRHSFLVGRADLARNPIAASVSRNRARMIDAALGKEG